MANSKEMTGGAVFPLLFSFTMPLLLGNLLQQTYSLIDAAIVGKFLGINSLAAVGASTSVIFLILGFCNGCCAGFGIPVAQKFGARDYATMRRYVAVGLQLATVDVRGDRPLSPVSIAGISWRGDADTREYLRWGL